MRSRIVSAGLLAGAVSLPAAALAAADLERGTKALRAAYEQTEGDEGGYGGTLVEQCRVDSDTVVRCVRVMGEGNWDLDSHDSTETRAPMDWVLATFGPDDRITTSREDFAEAPVELDADIVVPQRLKLTRAGRVVAKVSPDVASRVTIDGWFGAKDIKQRRPHEKTVEVPGAETTKVAFTLRKSQRRHVKAALRKRGAIRTLLYVRVLGDVGPADATAVRWADVRVVR